MGRVELADVKDVKNVLGKSWVLFVQSKQRCAVAQS